MEQAQHREVSKVDTLKKKYAHTRSSNYSKVSSENKPSIYPSPAMILKPFGSISAEFLNPILRPRDRFRVHFNYIYS